VIETFEHKVQHRKSLHRKQKSLVPKNEAPVNSDLLALIEATSPQPADAIIPLRPE